MDEKTFVKNLLDAGFVPCATLRSAYERTGVTVGVVHNAACVANDGKSWRSFESVLKDLGLYRSPLVDLLDAEIVKAEKNRKESGSELHLGIESGLTYARDLVKKYIDEEKSI